MSYQQGTPLLGGGGEFSSGPPPGGMPKGKGDKGDPYGKGGKPPDGKGKSGGPPPFGKGSGPPGGGPPDAKGGAFKGGAPPFGKGDPSKGDPSKGGKGDPSMGGSPPFGKGDPSKGGASPFGKGEAGKGDPSKGDPSKGGGGAPFGKGEAGKGDPSKGGGGPPFGKGEAGKGEAKGGGPPAGIGGNQPQNGSSANPEGAKPEAETPRTSTVRLRATTPMTVVFFIAACCVIINSCLAAVVLVLYESWADCLNLIYIMLFGAAIGINDIPCCKTVKFIGDMRFRLWRHLRFVCKLTGKSVSFIFLGCALLSALYNNLNHAFFQFTGLLLNTYVIVVGIIGLTMGNIKSKKLSRCKQALGDGKLEDVFAQYCKQYPPQTSKEQSGLTQAEFSTMMSEQAGVQFDVSEQGLIFDALVSDAIWRFKEVMGQQKGEIRIPLSDLTLWLQGGMVYL